MTSCETQLLVCPSDFTLSPAPSSCPLPTQFYALHAVAVWNAVKVSSKLPLYHVLGDKLGMYSHATS